MPRSAALLLVALTLAVVGASVARAAELAQEPRPAAVQTPEPTATPTPTPGVTEPLPDPTPEP
ncbi:MAG: LytR family transcriptional regulator, partial [Actinomycetota bacterium]|nr:LytR family transcriptional regulator [Actinomycetota bacterium]